MRLIDSLAARSRKFIQHRFVAVDIDPKRTISLFSLIGLPLLFASAYFLPVLTPTGAYLLQSNDLIRLVVLPSLVGVLVGSGSLFLVVHAARRWLAPRLATFGAVIAVSIMCLVGLKSIMYAAGYDWRNVISHGHDMLASARRVKYAMALIVIVVVWVTRGALPKWSRLLSSLGFAVGALAIFRLLVVWFGANPPPLQARAAGNPVTSAAQGMTSREARRVVWVIFDESDFGLIYPVAETQERKLANFARLAQSSVFATNANSPASSTLYSIPALLMGQPLGGSGIRISASATLSIQSKEDRSIGLREETTIFGALAANGRTASVLGFYHPYCKLFKLRRCDSFAYPEAGGLDAVLWANSPDAIEAKLRRVDYWESMTREMLDLLPEYMALNDALTFVHLNVPHPPSNYANKVLHLSSSADPIVEYSHNLMLADRVLGDIIRNLVQQIPRQEVLLVVSTDHWFRNRWYQADKPEASRPVLFIAWKVGETKGYVLSQPVSTVHTADMILDYLNGKLNSQADIAGWWADQPVDPSFIAPAI